MSKDLPWFKFYTSEWLSGDISLCSNESQVLFIKICCLYWDRKGDLELEKAKRRFESTCWNELLDDNIIKLKKDYIVISFLDEQLEKRDALCKRNKTNGIKGGRPKKNPKKTDWVLKNNPNETNLEEKRREKKINIDFDVFWNAYDKKIDKDKSMKLWQKLSDQERSAIMEYIPKYVLATPDKGFRKHPTTFLNNRSWEDELIQRNSKENDSMEWYKPTF